MNITINDLEMNTTLDQAAMSTLFGGHSYHRHYGAWKKIGSYTKTSLGNVHMGSWFKKGYLWKRYGKQYAKVVKVYKFRRKIMDHTYGY